MVVELLTTLQNLHKHGAKIYQDVPSMIPIVYQIYQAKREHFDFAHWQHILYLFDGRDKTSEEIRGRTRVGYLERSSDQHATIF